MTRICITIDESLLGDGLADHAAIVSSATRYREALMMRPAEILHLSCS
jgi:hypothetical protein